eukprot:5309658-Alexandrium_andersonii.AAC.1
MQGGVWTAEDADRAEPGVLHVCPRCGEVSAGLHHLLWLCPATAACREELWAKVGRFDPDSLPPCLRLHGIPPAMAAHPIGAPWVEEWQGPVAEP